MSVIHNVGFTVSIGFRYTYLRELKSTWHLMCLVFYFEEVQFLTSYNLACNLVGQIWMSCSLSWAPNNFTKVNGVKQIHDSHGFAVD